MKVKGWGFGFVGAILGFGVFDRRLIHAQTSEDDSFADCDAGFRLDLNFLNETLFPTALCADGTNGGYYFATTKNETSLNLDKFQFENRSFVIWLGDSETCSGSACADICEGSAREAAGGDEGVCAGINDTIFTSTTTDTTDAVTTDVARCLYSRATCTSSWWNKFETVVPATILCEGDSFFGKFKRVFIPSCSMDYWLGNENSASLPSDSFSTFLFRGNVIFRAVISTLLEENFLGVAPKIVLGGTRGAGIAALHLVNDLRLMVAQWLEDNAVQLALDGKSLVLPEIYVLVDSSWLVSMENFAVPTDATNDERFALEAAYKKNTSDWIGNAQILQSCKDKFPVEERFKCLFPSEIIKHHINNRANFPSDTSDLAHDSINKVLIVQSQYDLFQLQDLGILSTDQSAFEDEASFAQAALTFIENYALQVRTSLFSTSLVSPSSISVSSRRRLQSVDGASSVVSFWTSACAQFGYIVPTRVHTIESTVEQVGDAGSIQFQANELAWKNITLKVNNNEINLRQVIVDFINGVSLPKVMGDTCGEFLCNEGCVTKVFPFVVTPLVSICVRQLVFVYAFFLLFTLVFLFFLSYLQIRRWRKSCEKFWEQIKLVDDQHLHKQKSKELMASPSSPTNNVNEEVAFLKSLATQRNQTADEVQNQLILETNAEAQYRRVHLMLENVSYWAPPKVKSILSKCGLKQEAKGVQILSNVSIAFAPGQVHAIMGPSGSGKSTLMELVSLSKADGRMSGTRYINGVSANAKIAGFLRNWLKINQSYVTQQDFFFPTLTVREHLEHCAWLILPEYMPDRMKLKRVWQIIRLLDLTNCADTLLGDGGINYEGGISGGQRRRVSVATQLLLNPCVLFLDEPTSGLDSVSALNLVKRLQVFAKKAGVNVIMTIHQPRREIFQELDKLYVMVKGRLIFAGTVPELGGFFNLDHSNPELNIGNEMLDILKDINDSEAPEIKEYIRKYKQTMNYTEMMMEMSKEKTILNAELAEEIKSLLVLNSLAEGRYSWKSPSGVFWLQWVLISRTIKRGGMDLQTSAPLCLLAGIILGGLFFQADNYSAITGFAYLLIGTLNFLIGVFLARRYFDEKDMYDFEYRSGVMKHWQAFLFSQYSRDAVTSIIESLCFSAPAYFLGGFQIESIRLLNFFLLAMLIGYATISQNVLVQIDRNRVRAAATVNVGLLALGVLFNGFIVKLDDLPPYYAWIPYVMLNFYGFVGILSNELGNFSLPCNSSVLECASRTGDIIIRLLNYDKLDVFICCLCLIGLILLTRTLGAIDFYIRWTNWGDIKRVAADGESKRVANNVSVQTNRDAAVADAGPTVAHMLNAQTSSKLIGNIPKSKSKHALNSKVSRSDSRPSLDESDSRGEVNTKPPGSEFAIANPNNNVDKELPDFRFEQPNKDLEEEEDEEIDDSQPVDYTGSTAILLSPATFALFFVLDLASAGYICALNSANEQILKIVASIFVAIYGLQFFFQIGFLIPFTLDRTERDFIWAGDLDGPSFILLIIDICLVFLQFTINADLVLIMTLVIRLVRIVRVVLYFYKNSRAHRVRAKSFLRARQIIIDDYAKELQDVELQAQRKQEEARNWLSSFMPTSGNQISNPNPQPSRTRPNPDAKPARPPRPQRPARPNIAGAHISANMGRFLPNMYGPYAGVNLPGNRASHNNLVRGQMSRFQHAVQHGQEQVRRASSNSGRFLNAVRGNKQRPIRPEPTRVGEAEFGWVKYVNDKTGQVLFYNTRTGQWVDEKEVDDAI